MWRKLDSEVDDFRIVETVWAVKQENLNKLEEIVWSISDPGNVKYGNYLSNAQLSELVSPLPTNLEKVKSFISSSGGKIVSINKHHDMISATFTISQLEQLFGAKFFEFSIENPGTNHSRSSANFDKEHHRILRSELMTIPSEISEYIDTIFNIIDFPLLHKRYQQLHKEGKNCFTEISHRFL